MSKPKYYLPFDQEESPKEFYEQLAQFDPRLPDWATVTDVTIEFNRDDETVFVGLEVTVMPATSRIEKRSA